MSLSRTDAIRAVNKSKAIVEILEINKWTNKAMVLKIINEAIKNQHTIIIVK